MAPKVHDTPVKKNTENLNNIRVENIPENVNDKPGCKCYKMEVLKATLNALANILIGVILTVVYWFAFQNGTPLGATPLHIVLCVTGYHLLMAQAVLSMSSSNGWSSALKVVDKRRAHWILQIMGSGLAITGSFIKILDKEVHWNTTHGQFALVALVFTSVSLVSGLSSLYTYELRGIINGNIMKLSHICFGTVAFCAAAITLCLGLDKALFRTWATYTVASTTISFVALFAFIIITSPVLNLYKKSATFFKR